MTRIVPKLTAYVAYDGHSLRSVPPRFPCASGTLSVNTRSVAATANTPSLNASVRALLTGGSLGQACAWCCFLKRRAFSRLPHDAIVHQRLEWFLELSKKAHRQVGDPHSFNRPQSASCIAA